MSQATVTAVTGNAVIVKADGTTRALQVGEVVQRGDVIRTQAGARVELLLPDGQIMAMGPNQALRVDETVALTDATPQAADAAVQATTVAEIVQILEQGLDLLEQIDPAAAGAVAAGAGEGSDFVRLLRVAEPVEPLAFQFNLAAADTTDEIEGDPAPVTIDLSFELEEESALGLDGNDETDDGLSASRSGNFLTGVGGVLTSFSVPGLGFIAIAPGGSTLAFDANGQVIPPGATTPPSVLLTVQPNGDYTLTVVGPLNHPTPGTVEELLSLSPIALIGTAGTGGYLTINLAISVADDVPAAILGEDAGPRVDTALLDEDALQGGNADGNPLRPGEFNAGGSAIANGDIVDNVSWGADGFGRVTSVSWNGGSINLAANATSATVYILASGALGDPANAAIRLTVGADGSYSFELLRAQSHGESGEDLKALLEGGFTFNAVDGDGDPVEGGVRVNVNVRDDIPVITFVGRNFEVPEGEYDAMLSSQAVGASDLPLPGAVTVDESDFETDDTSAAGTVHFTVSFGADGPAVGGGKLYVLEARTGDATGLIDTATGQPVLIAQGEDGNILGVVTINNVQVTVFEMSVIPTTGEITFDQKQGRAVRHPNADDDNDSVSIAKDVILLRLTATDGDGDAVSATVDVGRLVSIADDGPSISQAADTVLLDEDALQGANADAQPPRAGEVDAGGSASASASGSIVDNVNWGADGFGRVTGVSWTGGSATLAANETSVTVFLNANAQLLGSNTGAVLSLQVFANGNYTVTLLDNLLIAGAGENLVSVLNDGFTFNAVDGDGDAVAGGVRVNVNVQDDVPLAVAERSVTATVAENDINTRLSTGTSRNDGNADGSFTGDPGQSRGPATVSGSLASLVSFGADGAAAGGGFGLSSDFAGLTAQALTSAGAALSYAVSGNTLTATVGSGNAARTVFTLEVQPNGNYTLRLFDQLDHPPGAGANNLALDLSSAITATDADGDRITLSRGFTVNVTDDVPQLAGILPAVGLVEEEALPGGNPKWPNLGAVASGSVAGQAQSGADDPLTFSLNPVLGGLPTLTSAGLPVNYAISGNILTATAGSGITARTVFTLEVQSNGDYTFTLRAPIDHPAGQGENWRTLDLSSAIVATDRDGDALVLRNALSITVIDDEPRVDLRGAGTVAEDAAGTITGTWSVQMGADQPGAVEVRLGGQSHAIGTPITVNVGGQAIGTLTVNVGGTWSFDPNPNLNNPNGVHFTFSIRATDADSDVESDGHRITVTDGRNPSAGAAQTLALDEEALGNANATGTNPASSAEAATATLAFTAGSDDLVGFAFANDLSSLVRNTDGETGPELTWTRTNATTLTATFGASNDVALTLTLTAPASIAHGTAGSVSVTATLSDNLRHELAGGEQVLSLGSIGVVATDRDGDAATGTVNLSVQDDVPSITVSPTQNLRESFEGFVTTEPNQGGWFVVGENGRTLVGNDGIVWTLNEAGIEIQRGNVGGAAPSDGAHKAELDAHNLAGGNPSTLSELSTQINVPGTTFGMSFDYQPRPADRADSAMTVSLNGVQVTINADANGVVSITAPAGVTATQTPGSNGWTGIALVFSGLTPGLQTLSFAGLSDNPDGDTLGAFLDNIRLSANNPLLVDETFMDADPPSVPSAVQHFRVSFGADGAAASNGGRAYDLVATNGTLTGLTDTATRQDVVVRLGTDADAGKVFGVAGIGGPTVFVMSVNATSGELSFDQQRAVVHGNPDNPNDSVSLAEGVINLRLTATDGDGDTATAMVDVGRLVGIYDDAPQARNDTDSATNGLATGNVITGLDTTNTPAGADAPGADGATVAQVNGSALQFDPNNSGWSAWINGSHGKIRFQADGDYEYQANPPVPLPLVTANYSNQPANVSVTAYTLGQSFFNATGQFASGGTGTVSSGGAGGNHFGVAGTSGPNAAVPEQINYSGSLSEALAFTFTGGPVTSATVSVSNLFQNEPTLAHGEAARWHAFDTNGVRIGTGIISNNESNEPYAGTTTVTWANGSNNVGIFRVSGIGAFSTLVIEALPYSEDGSLKKDDSDFFARVLSFQPQPPTAPQSDVFNYTLSDGDGDRSIATLTIQSSPQGQTGELVNHAPVAVGNSYSLAAGVNANVGNIILDDQGGGGAASGRDWDPDTPVQNLSVAEVIVNGQRTSVVAGGTTVALTHGTLTIHPNGSYTYTVGRGSETARTDTFEYVLRDVHGAQSAKPATVSFLLPAEGGAWFISHQGNDNNHQTYKLEEGNDSDSRQTFNVQFRPSNDHLGGRVGPDEEVKVVFDITGTAGPGDFNVVGVNPSQEFSATWVLSADGQRLSVTLKNISGKDATLQGGPFDVTVQALADNVKESNESLRFELNSTLTQRGVWEGNDFIQYTIEDEKAANTVFRFDMQDDTRGTARVVGFDGKDAIEIHMKDVLDLGQANDSLAELRSSGIVAFTRSNSQNDNNSTLTIDSKSGETQTIHFDRSFALDDLQLNVSLNNDILKFTHRD
ncbi:retention module-containing protein [Serpentinimonas maccroryi]|uniref:retention module-containing protein n=1 Tax=Serpentinimonas maccroryi TaxID=1458426 RepID=UPI002033AC20|nr:retention module-containing protein [Serpentinimonas maccroryi]MCM2478864.1 retention module-containing protein [Serpentinimonas maccroryi]